MSESTHHRGKEGVAGAAFFGFSIVGKTTATAEETACVLSCRERAEGGSEVGPKTGVT